MEISKSESSGVGIWTVLLVVFVTLKLAGLVAWSWFWVLSPVWINVFMFVLGHAVVATYLAFKEK